MRLNHRVLCLQFYKTGYEINYFLVTLREEHGDYTLDLTYLSIKIKQRFFEAFNQLVLDIWVTQDVVRSNTRL